MDPLFKPHRCVQTSAVDCYCLNSLEPQNRNSACVCLSPRLVIYASPWTGHAMHDDFTRTVYTPRITQSTAICDPKNKTVHQVHDYACMPVLETCIT